VLEHPGSVIARDEGDPGEATRGARRRSRTRGHGRTGQDALANIRFMGRNGKKSRRLLVGDDTYLWSVGHAHRVEYVQSGRSQGRPAYKDCRDLVTIRRFGARGRLVLSFLGGPGRRVSDGCGAGGVVGSRVSGWLNLHEPGTARALLDQALASGWQPDDPATKEIDGWVFFDTVVTQRSAR